MTTGVALGVNIKFYGLTLHEWQWLMLTHIERCSTIVVNEPLSQRLYIPHIFAGNPVGNVLGIGGGSWPCQRQEQVTSQRRW